MQLFVCLLAKIKLPTMPATTKFLSYKTMQRKKNTHAYVNAAIKIDLDASFNITAKPNLIFGGIAGDFVHATQTEALLNGKNLSQPQTLKDALNTLAQEVVPTPDPVLASPAYRKYLTQALFYRVNIIPGSRSTDI